MVGPLLLLLQVCSNCGTSVTPLWRRERMSGSSMCNACGIYFKNHGRNRYVAAHTALTAVGSCMHSGASNGEFMRVTALRVPAEERRALVRVA
jgi:hypothetical protein